MQKMRFKNSNQRKAVMAKYRIQWKEKYGPSFFVGIKPAKRTYNDFEEFKSKLKAQKFMKFLKQDKSKNITISNIKIIKILK